MANTSYFCRKYFCFLAIQSGEMNQELSILPSMKILDIVDRNYVYGTVLRFFGIDFYKYPESQLGTLCKDRGINMKLLMKHLGNASRQGVNYDDVLPNYPVDIVIEYLKDGHKQFVRHQLPYMADLIANIAPCHFDNPELAKDLKFVFPLFAEDFIRHIYEEEATLFKYIVHLQKALAGNYHLGKLFFEMNRHSISIFASEHLEEDDEMEGIRLMTNNYAITEQTSTYTKVIYSELQQFEKELSLHAAVENNILLQKAQILENQVWDLMRTVSKKN